MTNRNIYNYLLTCLCFGVTIQMEVNAIVNWFNAISSE